MINHYLAIARFDHWTKNIFIIPGWCIALALTSTTIEATGLNLVLTFIAAGFISSANYVLNEWLDAEFDKHHPTKHLRPAVYAGLKKSWVLLEYIGLALVGFLLGCAVNEAVFWTLLALLLQGIMYNVRPLRTKEIPYLDVISESINNPLRFLLGWFAVSIERTPPLTILISYWFLGAYLMGMKRYAESREFVSREAAAAYRRSFQHYTSSRLLFSSFLYASACAIGFILFGLNHRPQILFTTPLWIFLFFWYTALSSKPNSPAQHPERLYQAPAFCFTALATTGVFLGLLLINP